jgi:putative NADH-flavin reductase
MQIQTNTSIPITISRARSIVICLPIEKWRCDMKLAIFGASKGIGHQLLRIAIEDGHEVTALLRTPNSLKISHPNLHIIKGDILEPIKVANVTNNQDGICVCIGIPPTRKSVDVFSKGIKNILSSIDIHTKPKLIVITGIGAGDSEGHGGFLYGAHASRRG